MPPAIPTISHSLAEELAARLKEATAAEVRFDGASRALYASDLSHYRQVPIGVVIPRTVEDVLATVAICREYGVPLFGRGAGTSLAGQTCNVAVVLDFSKYLNTLLELNPEDRWAWVEPGIINDHLRSAAEKHGLTFAPDPATHEYCTLGGMIGNNSCGAHSVLGGKTSENIEELDILLYDGTRMTVGATTEDELQRIIDAGGRKGDIYARLRELRDRYAHPGPRALPGHPAPRLRLQPRLPAARKRLQRGPRAGRYGKHLRHYPASPYATHQKSAASSASAAGLPQRLSSRRPGPTHRCVEAHCY